MELYPDPGSKGFGRVLLKEEFFDSKAARPGAPSGSDQCDAGAAMRLTKAQTMVSSFVSQGTPYRSLVVYHGVGSGKTCAAVQVIEGVAGSSDKKPLVVAPPLVKDVYANTFFGPKYQGPASQDATEERLRELIRRQCTGTSHVPAEARSGPGKPPAMTLGEVVEKAQASAMRSVRFVGHEAFRSDMARTVLAAARRVGLAYRETESEDAVVARAVSALEKEEVRREAALMFAESMDGRLLVLDEAHRSVPHDARSRSSSIELLLFLLRSCSSLKLVVMSATPFYDKPAEVVAIARLVAANEGLPDLRESDVFDSDRITLLDGWRERLRSVLLGRVSFLGGSGGSEFPERLPGPHLLCPARDRDPADPESMRVPLPRAYAAWREAAGRGKDAGGGVSYVAVSRQLSNFCYPGADGGGSGAASPGGKEGFRRAFIARYRSSGGASRLSVAYKPGFAGVLAPDRLAEVSPKAAAVVEGARRCKGAVFVYSDFLWFGVIPLAVALEEVGFLPHSESGRAQPLLDRGPGKPARAPDRASARRYFVISDDPTISSGSVSQAYAAVRAGLVDVVLGSRSAGEGISLPGIREVFVMEPWFNVQRTEQAVGRAIRRCSHAHLPPERRNVAVFVLCAAAPRGARPSTDETVSRTATAKNKTIRVLREEMRAISVDCGAYEEDSAAASAARGWPVEDSRGRRVPPDALRRARAAAARARGGEGAPPCALLAAPGRQTRAPDSSSMHPYFRRHAIDMTSLEAIAVLEAARGPVGYEELRARTGADDYTLSFALQALTDPVTVQRWSSSLRVLAVAGSYLAVPVDVYDVSVAGAMTVAEAISGGRAPPLTLPFTPPAAAAAKPLAAADKKPGVAPNGAETKA
jgi:hypothetical protein